MTMDRHQPRKSAEQRNGTASRKQRESPRRTGAARDASRHNPQDDGISLASSAALIGLGALLKPRLLAGMALGAGIMMASRTFSEFNGELIRPLLKAAIKAGHAAAAAARETMAEVSEELEDIAAEALAEHEQQHHGQDTSANRG
jgi:uncharacterized protein DUF5132